MKLLRVSAINSFFVGPEEMRTPAAFAESLLAEKLSNVLELIFLVHLSQRIQASLSAFKVR
jgi:hypothetical protein